MNGNIIIIDGISNSGKTSFCEYLSKKGYILIEEVPLFIKNNRDKYDVLPSTIPKSIDEEKNNQQILLNAEYGRLFQAEKLALNGKDVVMDRSFFSTVAMAYALEKDAPFKGSYDNAKKLAKDYLLVLQKILKRMDVSFVVFDVDKKTLLDRNLKREKPLNLEWIEEYFLDKQRISFNAFMSALNGRIINTSSLSFDEICIIIGCNNNLKKI